MASPEKEKSSDSNLIDSNRSLATQPEPPKLRSGAAEYRELFAHSMDAVLLTAPTGEILYANPAACTLFGYSEAELQAGGRNLVIDPNDPRLPGLLAERRKTGQVRGILTFIRGDGTRFEGEVSSALFMLADGHPRSSLFIRDVTERSQAKAALHNSEMRFSNIITAAMDAVIGVNAAQQIVLFNPAAEKMFGYQARDTIGKPLEILIPERFRKSHSKRVDDFGKAAGEGLGIGNLASVSGLRRNGEEFPLEASISHYQQHGQDFYTVILRDITERHRIQEELRESESRLSLARTAGKIGIWDLDLINNRLIWDERMYEIYGVEPGTFGGAYEDWQQGVHPDDLARSDAEVQQAIRDRREFHTEFRVVRPAGEVRHIEAHGLVIYSAKRQPLRMVGVNTDVTERKQAEKSLQESEARLSRLVQHINAGIVVHAPDTHILQANERASTLLGLTIDQLLGKTAIDPAWNFIRTDGSLMPPEAYPVHQVLAARSPISGYVVGINRPVTRDVAWVLVNAFPEMNEDGTIRQVVVTFVDITALKQAEEVVRQSEENLRITLNSIGDAVIATDTNNRIVWMNPVAERLSGWPQAEALGQPFHQIFPLGRSQSREPVANPVETVLETGQSAELGKDTVLTARDGREYHVTHSGAPIQNAQRETIGVVLVLRDVTRQIQTEQELLKARQLETLGILAGGIAHDFNNLLTALSGNLELAKLALPPTHQSYRYLEAALSAGDKAVGLSNQLLTFAKGGVPVKGIQDLGHLLTETADFIMHGSKARLQLDVAPDLWLAGVDRGQISQVINNLIINAQQAMPNGGVIALNAVNVEVEGHPCVKITIRDDGAGIAAENLGKIFDPYFSTKTKNSGLGLTTVQSIIAKHNGQITVSSQVQQGTTFTLLLPASPQASPVMVSPAPKSRVDQFGAARILVLDDDEMIRVLLEEMLSQIGHQVTVTADGRETIEVYHEAMRQGNPYQAVILDLTIPGGIGGQEVAQEILALDPQARLVVSSGYANDPIIANYSDYGFKAQMQKPYRLAALQQTLQEILA